ncbi:Uncharacterised protein [Klebsiella pneumoniae]|nr:Uncharacterised protein [Klebsiella pneumoniae]
MWSNYYISHSSRISQFTTIATSHIDNYVIKLFIELTQRLADVSIF